jgi:glycerol-3-phosphate O-acyltransferase
MSRINSCADVNAVNLLATAMLATPKHCLDEQDLLAQLSLYRTLLLEGSQSQSITLTERDESAIITHGFNLGLLQRREHPLGDILSLAPDCASNLTYFRNNVIHLLAIPSLIACCLLNQRECPASQVKRIASEVYPFLKVELFLPWTESEFPEIVQANIELLENIGLVHVGEDSSISRAEGGTVAASQMNLLAHTLLQTMERYFITISILNKNGPGTLSRGQLEKLCILTAQRISQLHQFEAPEFSDRGLFREFIAALRDNGYLSSNQEGALVFDERLQQMGRDARLILSREVRHGIMRIAPQALVTAASGVEVRD